jgi:predicted aminopeptidase
VTLYASPVSVEDKRAGKAAAFASMRASYDALKKEWGGFAAYDGWFAQGPSNANLAAVGLYTQKVPEFHALLAANGGDLRRFYANVRLALPKGERDSALAAAAAANRTAGTTPAPAPAPLPPS